MKILTKVLVLALALTFTGSAQAGPFQAIGRFAKGRVHDTVDLVKFKHPAVTIAFIASIGASFADGYTTRDAGNRGAVETNSWIYGPKPSMHRVTLTQAAIDFAFGLNNEAVANYAEKNNISWGKYVAPTPSAILASFFGQAAYHNTSQGYAKRSVTYPITLYPIVFDKE